MTVGASPGAAKAVKPAVGVSFSGPSASAEVLSVPKAPSTYSYHHGPVTASRTAFSSAVKLAGSTTAGVWACDTYTNFLPFGAAASVNTL